MAVWELGACLVGQLRVRGWQARAAWVRQQPQVGEIRQMGGCRLRRWAGGEWYGGTGGGGLALVSNPSGRGRQLPLMPFQHTGEGCKRAPKRDKDSKNSPRAGWLAVAAAAPVLDVGSCERLIKPAGLPAAWPQVLPAANAGTAAVAAARGSDQGAKQEPCSGSQRRWCERLKALLQLETSERGHVSLVR